MVGRREEMHGNCVDLGKENPDREDPHDEVKPNRADPQREVPISDARRLDGEIGRHRDVGLLEGHEFPRDLGGRTRSPSG